MKINLDNWTKLQATREKLKKEYGYFKLTIPANEFLDELDTINDCEWYISTDDAQFYMLRAENRFGETMHEAPYHHNEFIKLLEIKQ
jgi:hypothetical protein